MTGTATAAGAALSLARTTIAPFAVLRVAAFPYELLTSLTASAVPLSIDQLLAAQRRVESLRQPLEDALYAAVPRVGREVRGEVLALRRAVHNGRFYGASTTVREALQQVSASAADLLESWLREADLAERQHTDAQAMYDGATQHEFRKILGTFARSHEFLRAVAVASPELFEAISRGEWKPRTERSVLSYAIRGAAKTSPFGLFMHQAVLTLDEDSGEPAPEMMATERTSRSYVNPGIECVLRRDQASAYVVNPRLRWVEQDVIEIRGDRLVTVGGRLWRTDLPTRIRLHSAVALLLRGIDSQLGTLEMEAMLERIGVATEMARVLTTKLIESSVLIPFEWNDLKERVDRASAIAQEVSAASASRRAALLHEAKTIAPAEGLNVLLEDGCFARSYGPVGGQLTGLMREVGDALAPMLSMRWHYRALRDAFVERFGTGGVCHNVTEFLRRLTDEGYIQPPRASTTQSMRPPAGVTVLLQVAEDATGTVAVLNQVHAGCGWLTARFAGAEDEGGRELAQRLPHWLQEIKASRELIDVPICADCNPLQSHPRLTRRSLAWPGEPVDAEVALAVDATVLKHDVETDLLELYDGDETPLAPVYLGGTLPTPAWGARFWLTVIAEPFGIQRALESPLPPSSEVEWEHRSRVQRGRVVLSRESWWIKTERLVRTWFHSSGVRRLAQIAADREQLGLPRIFFARPVLDLRDVKGGDAHKPLWVDSMNPACLSLLESLLAKCEWIVLTELLPDPTRSWSPFRDARHVSELLVEMTV